MPRITSSIMDDNAHEFVVEILVSNYFVKNDLLILIEVFLGPILLLHLFNQVLSCHVLLTVWSHVQVHWEGAVVIKLDLLHRVKIKLESLKLQDEDIRKSFDRASLQRISLHITLFTVICVISFKPLSLNKCLKGLLN